MSIKSDRIAQQKRNNKRSRATPWKLVQSIDAPFISDFDKQVIIIVIWPIFEDHEKISWFAGSPALWIQNVHMVGMKRYEQMEGRRRGK